MLRCVSMILICKARSISEKLQQNTDIFAQLLQITISSFPSYPLFRECIGALPEMSERHYEKHQSIRQLYIRPDIIAIEADCNSQEALRLVRKECDMLKEILQEAGYNWTLICPRKFSGSLPTISSVKLSLNGVSIPEELVTAQFSISQKKAFSILEGGNVYQNKFVFLREFLQNAIDASKIQYWTEYLGSKKYSHKTENLRSMSPNEMDRVFSTENFPIQIEMEVVKRDEEYREFPVPVIFPPKEKRTK